MLLSVVRLRVILPVLLLALYACSPKTETESNGNSTTKIMRDVHSFGKPDEVAVTHIHLNLLADFTTKQLIGYAEHTLQYNNAEATELCLDTKDLPIESVTDTLNRPLEYSLAKADSILGSCLTIKLPGKPSKVRVHYTTSPKAEALQWLEPQQTAGGKHPFLFTQGEAILTRSWIPCQDSPGQRVTYTAEITTPKELMAVMSADNPTTTNPEGKYRFTMDKPVSTYLIALSIGELQFKEVGKNTGVYAEPITLNAAVAEFSEMEQMLTAAEELYGKYAWGRYDLIVLPPAFPFGGMENPKLTFATPTILAGDKSLTSLVAHELAHSWSGNLVTNATWNDFWLNEGFTVYFERRIMEKLKGKDYADMLAVLGCQDLIETVGEFGKDSPDTKLKLDLKGRNPDDGMNDIAYEKGYFLLRLIEDQIGREQMDKFLNTYFSENAFKTMDTERFISYLQKSLSSDQYAMLEKVNIKAWIYEPGIPANMPVPSSTNFTSVDKTIEMWKTSGVLNKLSTKSWSTHEWLHFLRGITENANVDKLTALDKEFNLTNTGNSELAFAWFMLSLKAEYKVAYPKMEAFLIKTGRRKFLTPIYKSMLKTEGGKTWAKLVYSKARPNYHFVAQNTMDELLN